MGEPTSWVPVVIGTALVVAGVFSGNPGLVVAGSIAVIGAFVPPPKISSPDDPITDSVIVITPQSVMVRSPTSPYQGIYGNIRVSGTITFITETGGKRQFLHLVITLAAHEVDSINELYLDDDVVPVDGSGDATGLYAGFVHVEKRLGAAGQTAYSSLITATTPEKVDASHRRFDGHGQTAYTTSPGLYDDPLGNTINVTSFNVHQRKQGTILSLDGSWSIQYRADNKIRFTDVAGNFLDCPYGNIPMYGLAYLIVQFGPSGVTLTVGAQGGVTFNQTTTSTPYVAAATVPRTLWLASFLGLNDFLGTDTLFQIIIQDHLLAIVGRWINGEPTDTSSVHNDFVIPSSWTTNHIQAGFANVYVRLKWSQDLFPNGIPNISFNVKGRKVYDPRTGLTVWSDNAALCMADFLQLPNFGLGVSPSKIDSTALITAANICDETMVLLNGSTEKRYTCNGAIQASASPQSTLANLASSLNGSVIYTEGLWKIYAGAWVAPTLSFDENDLRDSIQIQTRIAKASTFNAVKGSYIDPNNNWQPSDYPAVVDTAAAAKDGIALYQDLPLPFTISPTMAQRLAKVMLKQARLPITVTVPGRLSFYKAQPPDVIQFSNVLAGWVNKNFTVVQSLLVITAEGELGCDIILREADSTIYSWSSSEEGDQGAKLTTNLPSIVKIVPPLNPVLSSGTSVLAVRLDGTIFSRILVSWDAIIDEFVTNGGSVQAQFKKHADSTWISAHDVDGNATFTYILDVQDGVAYDVRVRSVNSAGGFSEWVEVDNYVVIGKTQPPANVTNFKALQSEALVVMSWSQVADLDLAGYDIRAGIVGVAFDSATTISLVEKGTLVTTAIIPQGTWDVLIKAKDTSGNASVAEARATITVTATFAPSVSVDQQPLWLGTKTNLIRNPLTGWLSPDSTVLANALGWEVFDQYVPSPFSSVTYEGTEIDLGADFQVNIWGKWDVIAGPGETGTPVPSFLIDHHLTADGYAGYTPLLLGQIGARFVKEELTMTLIAGACPLFKSFTEIVDKVLITEVGVNVSVPSTGLRVNFVNTYRVVPDFVLASSPTGLTVVVFDVSFTGLTIWLLDNASGLLTSGTISYTIEGV